MATALHITTRVLSGKRLEITSPELEEGTDVEVFVVAMRPPKTIPTPESQQGVMDYLNSLPPVQRTPEEWAAIEREFQEERDAWDR